LILPSVVSATKSGAVSLIFRVIPTSDNDLGRAARRNARFRHATL
jgi:hypothetical protein